jgi:hypothetical protein
MSKSTFFLLLLESEQEKCASEPKAAEEVHGHNIVGDTLTWQAATRTGRKTHKRAGSLLNLLCFAQGQAIAI